MNSAISFTPTDKTNKIHRIIHPLVIFFSLVIIFIVGPYLLYNINFMGKIYPNIYIAGINVGGLSQQDAIETLTNRTSNNYVLRLTSTTKTIDMHTKDILLSYDYSASVNRVYNFTRTGNFILDTLDRLSLIFYPQTFGLITNLDESRLASLISSISNEISIKPLYPSLRIVSGAVEVNIGAPGTLVDTATERLLIGDSLAFFSNKTLDIPIKIVDPTLNSKQVDDLKSRAEMYLSKSLILKHDGKNYQFNDSDIIKFLDPSAMYNNNEIATQIDRIAGELDQDPQLPKFEFDGTRVTEFAPALDGIQVDKTKLSDLIIGSLDNLAVAQDNLIETDIPIKTTKPKVATSEVNNLGIKEQIGHANSTYFHSIPGRVFNVNLAATRINGTLVPPGQTFSFNQTLGDVSRLTGYQQAYIISGGKTILGDGGGVCQVSTTLFRATLNAGLPIDERSPHAYRVGYYEQNSPPGFDATVYAPSPDFKFTNDTGNYILIVAKNDPAHFSLIFDLYGTRDGRVATVSKPLISNYTPPLPTIYQDDPTLQAGILKQTDFGAAGARVSFNYNVEKNGEAVFQKTFVSNYQPWAAIFLRGTKI